MPTAYLLTGMPGTGKTSLIRQIVQGLKGKAGGFYTEEIRDQGIRQGFRVVTLSGETALLSHVKIRSPHRVSKYGVDINALDTVGVSALMAAWRQCELVVIDEIGKMELFSDKFKTAVTDIIESQKKVLGTIMLKSDPWADALKQKKQVRLITLTRNNHQQVQEEIQKWLEI